VAFDGTLKFDTSIDQTGFDSGLSGLGSMAEKALSAVSELAKSAASEMWSLGQQAVQAGQGFESSMSQVIATMGITKDTIQDGVNSYDLLKQAAAAAGEATTFSASEAADALNYLALAGYSASQAADALPAVLNLASAGGMDLAYASDLATDAMAALGIEATKENLTHFGDQLAKTASKANASVSQLGEAILTVGGTAKSLANGTTELNAELGVLANRGIKGSEGGTALRNMILSLSAPTAQAAEQMAKLGLQAEDADGNLRPLNEVFKDLNASLAGLGGTEKDRILSEIFNKVDLKAVNALLAGCGEEFDSLTAELMQCDGAMAQMAETMNDTLEGDIKSFQSKAEALGIAVYDSLNAPLREIVQLGGEYVSQLTNAFKDGGFDGLAAELGTVLGQALARVTDYLPDMAELGVSVVNSLTDGLMQNLGSISGNLSKALMTAVSGMARIIPAFSTAGIRLISALAGSFASALPELMKSAISGVKDIASGIADNLPDMAVAGLTILDNLVSGIADNLPELIRAGEEILSRLADDMQKKAPRFRRLGKEILKSVTKSVSENIPLLTESVLKLIDFTVRMLTEPGNLSGLVDAAVSILLALADGLIQSVPVLIAKVPEIISHLGEGITKNAGLIEDSGKKILEQLGESLINAKDTLKDKAPEIMQNVLDALKNVALAAGSVADAVISAIADALGIGDKWDAVKEKISAAFADFDLETVKLNLELAFEDVPDDVKANFELVSETFSEASDRLKTSFDNLKESLGKLKEEFQPLIDKVKEYFTSGQAGEDAGKGLGTVIEVTAGAVAVAADALSRLISGIMNFGAWLAEGSSGADAFTAAVLGIATAAGSFAGILKLMEMIPAAIAGIQAAIAGVSSSAAGMWAVIAANPLGALLAVLAGVTAALIHVMNTSEEWQIGWQMIKETFSSFKDAWVTGWKDIKEKWEDFWDSWKTGEETLEKFGENIYDFIEGAKQWGRDLIDNFISGVTEKWNDWESTWEDVGGVIYDLLHHTHPDKGLLKDDNTWMPDMMLSFAEGIRSNIPAVTSQAERLAENLHSALAEPVSVNFAEPELFTVPELSEISTPELPEIENPEIIFDMPELPEFENPEIIFDMPDIPEMEISLQEIDPSVFSDLEILPPDVPEITVQTDDFPDFPNPEKTPPPPPDFPQMPSVSLPEPEVSAPEFRLPDWNLPKLSPEVVQAFRMQSARLPDFLTGTNQTAEIINQQYSYHTVNQNTQSSEQQPIELTLHNEISLDGQPIDSAVKKVIIDTNTQNGGWFI